MTYQTTDPVVLEYLDAIGKHFLMEELKSKERFLAWAEALIAKKEEERNDDTGTAEEAP